ncbi:MAG: hypothetical protein JWN44_1773 [Myxococcales bacterium]|nr:hypothetical protein [Myxococcales bacterium]
MSKPNYRATLSFDTDRKVFIARAPELEHCSGEGATRAEALVKLEEEIDAQLANMLSHGSTPPRAVDEETFSGEITAKVSKQLHRDLMYQARSEGIEIDQLVGELLAAAMESRKQHRSVRGGNSRPREDHQPNDNVGNRFDGGGGARPQRGFAGRGNNAHLLDDRANFIEYVRGLDQGSGQRHGGGGHGGPPAGGRGGDNARRRGRGGRGGNPNQGPQRGPGGPGGGRPQQAGGYGNPGGNPAAGNPGGNPGNGNPGGNPGNGNPNAGNSGFSGSAGNGNPAAPDGGPASHDPGDSSGNV